MRSRFLLVATTALLLLTAMPAQAQDVGIKNPETSTPTTLYFHVINVQDMPINTQIPDDSFTDDSTFGPGASTIKCIHPLTGDIQNTGHGTAGSTSQVYHTSYGYSSPSYVEYDYKSANGDPRTHPERGISYDAEFDQQTPFVIKWYVATFNGERQADQVPAPTPAVSVAASMRAGDAISVDDKAYDSGPVLAKGETAPATLAPGRGPTNAAGPGPQTVPAGDHPEVTYMGAVDGRHIYEFTVTMKYEADKIQRATGFNVRIDMFIDNPHCTEPDGPDKEYFMASSLVAFSNKDNRPRMELAIMNPIRLEYLHPQFVGDDLVVHTSMNSAWGNYDVDETTADGIKVSIEGPTPATSLEKAAFVQRFHEHYHHQEAVDVTYVWPYKADRAVNGVYTVLVSFRNDQQTAEATGVAQFEVGKGIVIGCGGIQESSQKLSDDCVPTIQVDGKDGTEKSPGLPLLGALGALGAVAVALRRRQT